MWNDDPTDDLMPQGGDEAILPSAGNEIIDNQFADTCKLLYILVLRNEIVKSLFKDT